MKKPTPEKVIQNLSDVIKSLQEKVWPKDLLEEAADLSDDLFYLTEITND